MEVFFRTDENVDNYLSKLLRLNCSLIPTNTLFYNFLKHLSRLIAYYSSMYEVLKSIIIHRNYFLFL